MAADRRLANRNWAIADENGQVYQSASSTVLLAVLMDIRDEMQKLNRLLHCPNFIGIPGTLDKIHRKIPTRRRRHKPRTAS